jgi:hypothetical protein
MSSSNRILIKFKAPMKSKIADAFGCLSTNFDRQNRTVTLVEKKIYWLVFLHLIFSSVNPHIKIARPQVPISRNHGMR